MSFQLLLPFCFIYWCCQLQESGPLLPEVETVTGEEAESNVMQINCKLFLFDDVSFRFVIRISRRDLNPRQLCHQNHGALTNDYTSIALVIYFTITYFFKYRSSENISQDKSCHFG